MQHTTGRKTESVSWSGRTADQPAQRQLETQTGLQPWPWKAGFPRTEPSQAFYLTEALNCRKLTDLTEAPPRLSPLIYLHHLQKSPISISVYHTAYVSMWAPWESMWVTGPRRAQRSNYLTHLHEWINNCTGFLVTSTRCFFYRFYYSSV